MKKVVALIMSFNLIWIVMIGIKTLMTSIVVCTGHDVFAQEEEIQFNDSDVDNVIDEDQCPNDPTAWS